MQSIYKDKTIKISTEDFEEPVGYDPEMFSCDGDVDINENQDPFGIGG